MTTRYPVFAVTHIHTEASNGEAPEMDGMIGGAIRALLGEDTPARWSECFTRPGQLVEFLNQKRNRPPVGIMTVTDHMNVRSHRLPDALLQAAAREPRLAACAEITTVERDTDGVFRRAPEVLVYGSARPVEGPYGRHFGLSQETIDDIFKNCRAPGMEEVRASLVLDHCTARGLACALAHPFDGHKLSLEATLDLISRGRYDETVNGGFPAVSTRILEDLISFQNRIVSGWRLRAETASRYPLARRLQEKIIDQGRSMLIAWGGSDAHLRRFSRVVVRFLSYKPRPVAGDLFSAMLYKEPIDHILDGTFSVQGRPGTLFSVLSDVVPIVLMNIWHNRPYMLDTPGHLSQVLFQAQKLVREELGRRAQRQESLVREASRRFNSNRILQGLKPPTVPQLRPVAQFGTAEALAAPEPQLPPRILDASHRRQRNDPIH